MIGKTDLFLDRLFNIRTASAGPLTAIYDRGWCGDIRNMWRMRMVWFDLIREDNAVGLQIGPLTLWWEPKGGAV